MKFDLSSPCRLVSRKRIWCLVGGLLLAMAAGCGRNDIQEYRVAKEPPSQAADNGASMQSPAAPPSGQPGGSGGGAPTAQWKRPENWEEVPPGEMRLASFRVAGKNGKQADVSIVPLPGMAGSDLANVNRWRGQLGLQPVSEEDLPKLAAAAEIGGQPGQLYDAAGTSGAGEKSRILAAVMRREGTAWFFKMTGDADLVLQQKPVFLEFLKSISFGVSTPELPSSHPSLAADSAPPLSAPPGAASSAGKPNWQVPSGWREIPGGPFLVAKFSLTGPQDAQAAVNVSSSAGDGGGLLANVNRWRGQLGLAPITEADLQQLAQAVDVPGGKAALVQMSGTDARTGQKAQLVAVIVPQGAHTWFYKLMGSGEIVEREKSAFEKFVQSAKYPNAS